MNNNEHQYLGELLKEHQKRLHKLELHAARQGQNTPAEILVEIESIQEQIRNIQIQLNTTTLNFRQQTPAPGQHTLSEILVEFENVKKKMDDVDEQLIRPTLNAQPGAPIGLKRNRAVSTLLGSIIALLVFIALLFLNGGTLSLTLPTLGGIANHEPSTTMPTMKLCVLIKDITLVRNTSSTRSSRLQARVLVNGAIVGEPGIGEQVCPSVKLPESNELKVRIQVFDANQGPPYDFLAVKESDGGINLRVTPVSSRDNQCIVAGDVQEGRCNGDLMSSGTEADIMFLISMS